MAIMTQVTGRTAVWQYLSEHGPSTDEELAALYPIEANRRGWPALSASALRSRRAELTAEGHVLEIDHKPSLRSGRRSAVWVTTRWLDRETRPTGAAS